MPASISTPQTLGTNYKDAASLGFQEGDSVVFQSTGGPIIFQFANDDPSGAVSYQDQEVVYPPGTWAFKNTKGIRFRSNIGSAAATLQSATLFFNDDPEPFTPGNVPGSVTLTSTLNIQHNDVLVGTEPTLDFEDGSNLTWTVADDGANSRIKVTPSLTGVVTSFNSRTGAVLPQSGDYSIGQISGNIVNLFNSRTGNVVPTTGDYTAAQVTNALDLSNAGTQTLTGALLVNKQFASSTSNSSVVSGAIAITTNAVRITATDGTNVANITGAIGAEPLYIFNTSGSTITFVTGGGVTGLRGGFTLVNGAVAFLYYDSSGGLWTPFSIAAGGVPAVNSVFGRTGNVVATTGDYTAAQVTNAADLSSASNQVFTGAVISPLLSTGPTTANAGGGGITGTGLIGTRLIFVNTTTDLNIRSSFTTDTQYRYTLDGVGTSKWGPGGSTVQDLTMGRAAKGSDIGFDFSAGTGTGWAQFAGAVYSGAATTFTTGGGVTWTPDYAAGNYQAANINVSGSTTLTITTPSNGPPAGETGYLMMFIENTGASGGTVLTWSGAFLNAFNSISKPTSVSAGTSIFLFFIFNTVTSGWKCVGQF